MLKAEKEEVWGFEHAIRGMRNPLESWNKSDSGYICTETDKEMVSSGGYCNRDNYCPKYNVKYIIGKNDLKLMHKLYMGGTEHRKYLRQIFLSLDITAPLYWWKEFDTYKIGTVSNSCSTMHTIHKKEFTIDDFSHEHLIEFWNNIDTSKYMDENGNYYFENNSIITIGDNNYLSPNGIFEQIIEMLNKCRNLYLETKDKQYWWQIIQLLPTSYNQKRTITMNYENVISIIRQRSGHKLDEWNILVKDFYKLPYIEEIIGEKYETRNETS